MNAPMNKAGGLDQLRILIVESNPHMMAIIKLLLRGYGMRQFVEATTCDEAWEKLQKGETDLVVMERLLAREDTLDLVRRVRNDPESRFPYMTLIMLSAYSEQIRIEEARDAGITEFCRKPVTARELFTKIAVSIDRPRPFVRGSGYFGPNRRRRGDAAYEGKERRQPRDAVTAG